MNDQSARPDPRPRRSLGQNFLVDPNTQRRIIGTLELEGVDHIVEIGPGRGALTEGLLELGVPLTVIEKDRVLAQRWAGRAQSVGQLTVIEGDALEVPLSDACDPSTCAVIGNIPYNVTTPLIFHLLERPRPRELVLMVQKEVADRLVSAPGQRSYGALSVGVQSVASVERVFVVPRTVFRPRPRVDSAVVRIRPLNPPPLEPDHERSLRDAVRACFGWRRKQLGTILRKHPTFDLDAGAAQNVLQQIGQPAQTRPEALTPDEFVALAEHVVSVRRTD